jgi:hypothetical protein
MVARMIIDVPDSEIAAKVVAAILVFCFLARHAASLAQKLCEAAIYVLNQGAVVARAVRNAAPAWKDFWREWDEARKAWRRATRNPTSQQPPGEYAKNNRRRKRGHASSRSRRRR